MLLLLLIRENEENAFFIVELLGRVQKEYKNLMNFFPNMHMHTFKMSGEDGNDGGWSVTPRDTIITLQSFFSSHFLPSRN